MKIFINVLSRNLDHKKSTLLDAILESMKSKKHKETEFTILNEFWISFDNSQYLYIKIQYNLFYNNKVNKSLIIVNCSKLLRSNYFLIYITDTADF